MRQIDNNTDELYFWTLIVRSIANCIMTSHTLIIGDSALMPEIDSGSIHFVVTSPPYWNLKKYGETTYHPHAD